MASFLSVLAAQPIFIEKKTNVLLLVYFYDSRKHQLNITSGSCKTHKIAIERATNQRRCKAVLSMITFRRSLDPLWILYIVAPSLRFGVMCLFDVFVGRGTKRLYSVTNHIPDLFYKRQSKTLILSTNVDRK